MTPVDWEFPSRICEFMKAEDLLLRRGKHGASGQRQNE